MATALKRTCLDEAASERINERLRLDCCWHWESLSTEADAFPVIEFVIRAMTDEGYSDRDLFSVRLGMEEAIGNAIRHGNRGDVTKQVRVRYDVDRRRVLIEVEDEGKGFNPDRVADPRAPENLEKPYGRGIFLMRSFLSWVRYNRRGNCVVLCKYRATREA